MGQTWDIFLHMRKQRRRSDGRLVRSDQCHCFSYVDSIIPLLLKSVSTSCHKGFFLGPEYLNNIFSTNSHIKGTCIAANFKSNRPLV